jgi:hypothetical protein
MALPGGNAMIMKNAIFEGALGQPVMIALAALLALRGAMAAERAAEPAGRCWRKPGQDYDAATSRSR